jgi:vacuolar-type H+-ATPase catalytic subunit A/Vma1
MFPALRRSQSQSRYADHLLTTVDELVEQARVLRSKASQLAAEQEHIAERLTALTRSGELAHCDRE